MKNSINLVLVIFAFVVLGCTCSSSSGFKSGDSSDEKKSESKPIEKSENKSESNENKKDSKDEDKSSNDLDEDSSDNKKDSNQSNQNNSKNDDEDSDSSKDSNDSDEQIPTMNQFRKIEQGMSYDEVVDIIGFEGKLIKTDRYLWGDNNRFIMISFQNDKVMMATQNGLK